MTGITMFGALTSFAAGMISFLSPCVLPLVPGYVSYVTGQSLQDRIPVTARLAALGVGVFFVLGFSTVFIILGASATAVGQLLQSYRYETNLIGGGIVIVFGLLMLGMVGLPVVVDAVGADLFQLVDDPSAGWSPGTGPRGRPNRDPGEQCPGIPWPRSRWW